MKSHFFTFGQTHMTNYPLSRGGQIKDYWVEVEQPCDDTMSHRELFMATFGEHHLPHPNQWGFEYTEADFKPEFFPRGRLCLITDDGGIGL